MKGERGTILGQNFCQDVNSTIVDTTLWTFSPSQIVMFTYLVLFITKKRIYVVFYIDLVPEYWSKRQMMVLLIHRYLVKICCNSKIKYIWHENHDGRQYTELYESFLKKITQEKHKNAVTLYHRWGLPLFKGYSVIMVSQVDQNLDPPLYLRYFVLALLFQPSS